MNLFTKTVLILTFGACAPKIVGTLTRSDVQRGQKHFPTLTIAELQDGKSKYETHCSTCHALKDPRSKTEAVWTDMVPKMSVMANNKAGMIVLDSAAQEHVLRYVITMMDAPVK